MNGVRGALLSSGDLRRERSADPDLSAVLKNPYETSPFDHTIFWRR